jgi:hypothetical protein
VITNSLGFKDAMPRNVPLHSKRKRVLFLGDSFTEGLGTSYNETFVGRFAAVVRESQMRPVAPELADPLNTDVIVSSFDN